MDRGVSGIRLLRGKTLCVAIPNSSASQSIPELF